MADYQVAYNPLNRVAWVQEKGADVPEPYINIGEFTLEEGANTVFYHHVRDLLYFVDKEGQPGFWPENETDMATISIETDPNIPVEDVAFTEETDTVAVGGEIQLEWEITPAQATNKNVSFDSSDEEVATVDADGLVTGVSEGTAIITVTTEDGERTDTIEITVTAE